VRCHVLAAATVACVVFVLSTETHAHQELPVHVDEESPGGRGTVAGVHKEPLGDASGDSDFAAPAEHDKDLLASEGGVAAPKVGKQQPQYAANSKEYTRYMDHLETEARRRKFELENEDVSAANQARIPPQFASPGLYQQYMKQQMKGYHKVASLSAMQHRGDDSIVDDEPEGLGESEKEAPPGIELISSPELPAVREAARGRPAAQSSIEYGGAAERAVDGRTDGIFSHGSCTHTKSDENPWWRVDLGKTMNMQHIEVYSRADCCGERLNQFEVRVGDAKDWQKNPKCGTKWSVPQGQSLKIPCTQLQGQYVFVVVRGTMMLNLCEIKVYASDNPGSNAAKGMPTSQSSTMKGGSADRAVDGHTNTDYADNSCTHTEYELKPWWKVDLGKPHTVAGVQIWNRGDCCGSRLSDFEVRVGNNPGVWSSSRKCGGRWEIGEGEHKEISCGGQGGRYVWVVLQNRNALTLCEVRVLTTYAKKGINLARSKPTEQSSTGYGGLSKRAVDGNTETNYKGGSCTHTHFDQEPWWRVDLQKPQAIGAVQIWNRGDCCGTRLSNFEVRVGDGAKWQGTKVCGDERQKIAQGKRKSILCAGAEGRFVYVVKRNQGYLNICEVRVLPFHGNAEDVGGACISKALGVESRVLKAGDMAASSFYGNEDEYGPNNGRLNYRGASWQPLHERVGQWLQVLLPKLYKVTGVATQGDFEADKWVTGYKVRYFNQDGKWKYVGAGDGQNFIGNIDRNTVRKTEFTSPVKATKVRIYPTNWKGAMALRMEVYGRTCDTAKEIEGPSGVQPLAQMTSPGAASSSGAQLVPGMPCPVVTPKQCDGRRRRSLTLFSEDGFGEGTARLWYAETKGAAKQHIAARSVYVSKGVDFRTEEGSIYAGKDLVAGKSVVMQAWPGFGHGSTSFWYAQRARKTFRANTLYLKAGDLSTQSGSIYASDSLRAGRYLEIGAFPGFGDNSAKLWYSASGKEKNGIKFDSETVYLDDASFATQSGSIHSAKDIIASKYLTMKAFPNYGEGEAQFWYVGEGKAPYKSNTVYLKNGNLATQEGSIISKYDVEVGQKLRLSAMEGFGTGETSLWYAKDNRNGYGPDAMYLSAGDLRTQEGSIIAGKNLIAGRKVQINAYPGMGSGSAELMYSNTKTADLESESLYLTNGDFRTRVGSIVAAGDLGAGRSVKIKSMLGNGVGEAELFYSHTAKAKFAARTLYLKDGDFRTQRGSIYAGDSLHASKYLQINAFPGFGEGTVKLWHCNKEIEGFAANSLYLQNGDFRTQDGSIHASQDLVTSRYLTIKAMSGYGSGSTKLWYSQSGKGDFRSNSLYLSNGDFHTEAGSIHAGKDLHAGRYLKIMAWPGHGQGSAELWHSKTDHQGFGADTVYLKTGHFHVQKGSLIAAKDVNVGRYIKVGAKEGYGTGSAQLWYSGSGKDGSAAHTLYLESGDFRTQDGDIRSAKDVVADGSLFGANLEVDYAYVPGMLTAGHLFLGGDIKPPSKASSTVEGAMEMLDIDSANENKVGKQESRNVGKLLQDLSDSNDMLVAKNAALRSDLSSVLARLDEALRRV